MRIESAQPTSFVQFMRQRARPVGLTLAAPVVGFLFFLIMEMGLDIEVPKLVMSIVNLAVVAVIAFVAYPKYLGIPFGKIETAQFLRRVGFYWPRQGWRHVLLGIVLAGCTLGGMLLASLLSGKYAFDRSTINLPHVVFSLNPGIWEEVFYRGVLLLVLLKLTGSFKKAAVFQVSLFTLMHIKDVSMWGLVDMFTVGVLALGFTYTAYKTRALLSGIVFHFLHDALLFSVQIPDGSVWSTADNILFYSLLWGAVGLACLLVWLASEKWGVRAGEEVYTLENVLGS